MVSFLTNNRYDAATGCWNWTGARNSNGYGHKRFHGALQKVHRLSAHFYLGYDLNSELLVLHKCDNPACFNPKHLFFGTPKDNMQDMFEKHRWRHPNKYKTKCPQGHPYSGENLYVYSRTSNGKTKTLRSCRICRTAAAKRFYDQSG